MLPRLGTAVFLSCLVLLLLSLLLLSFVLESVFLFSSLLPQFHFVTRSTSPLSSYLYPGFVCWCTSNQKLGRRVPRLLFCYENT